LSATALLRGRSVVEVMPKSMAERREKPGVIEQAYGVPEKEEQAVPLPPMFQVKERPSYTPTPGWHQ